MPKRNRLFVLIIGLSLMIFRLVTISTAMPTIKAAGTTTPTLDPNSGLIAFTSNRDGVPSIYVMKADGSVIQRLTSATANQGAAQSPAWSPDGKQLAYFLSPSDGKQGGLYVLDLTRFKEHLVAPDVFSPTGLANHPTWSPDGKQIAFAGTLSASDSNATLYVIDADGQNEYILMQGGPNSNSLSPSWSPDGQSIVYWTPTITNGNADTGTISLIAPNGSSQRQISKNGAAPMWSPDGQQIVYTSRLQVFIMNADGRNLHQVARATDGLLATSPTWSANGQQIAYAVGRTSTPNGSTDSPVKYQLFAVDITGNNLHALTPNDAGDTTSDPAWSPVGVNALLALPFALTARSTTAATLSATARK